MINRSFEVFPCFSWLGKLISRVIREINGVRSSLANNRLAACTRLLIDGECQMLHLPKLHNSLSLAGLNLRSVARPSQHATPVLVSHFPARFIFNAIKMQFMALSSPASSSRLVNFEAALATAIGCSAWKS